MDASLPPLLQATSGAVGSAIGNIIVFPLDLATTRLQHAPRRRTAEKLTLLHTLQRLIGRRGLGRLWSGARADTISTVISSFLYFYLFSALHKAAIRLRQRNNAGPSKTLLGPGAEIFIGMIAGVTAKGLTLPISAISTRQQLDSDNDKPPTSLLETLKGMRQEKGTSGLFAALPPSIPLALLPSLTLYIHSVLLRLLVPVEGRLHPAGSTTFLLAAASNALATLPLYPLVLAKSLAQTSGRGYSLRASLDEIYTREGFLGLYKGVEGQLVKGFLQQGVMMLVKQRVEEMIVAGYRRRLSRV